MLQSPEELRRRDHQVVSIFELLDLLTCVIVLQSPEELRRSLEELQGAVAAEREAAAAADRRCRELAAREEAIAKVCEDVPTCEFVSTPARRSTWESALAPGSNITVCCVTTGVRLAEFGLTGIGLYIRAASGGISRAAHGWK